MHFSHWWYLTCNIFTQVLKKSSWPGTLCAAIVAMHWSQSSLFDHVVDSNKQIVRTKFKSKHQPGSIQADTNFKHASAFLVAQLDEIFHHPDNKEILHTNVLASALLVTIEVTNLWQKKQFSHLTLIQKVTPSTSGALLFRNMTRFHLHSCHK